MEKKLIFDYIIVGTGPVGAVLAKMLSDNKRTSVLVLEAGGNQDRDLPIRDSTFAPELEESYSAQYFWQGVVFLKKGLMIERSNGRQAVLRAVVLQLMENNMYDRL